MLRSVDEESVSPDCEDNGSNLRVGALGRSPLGVAERDSGGFHACPCSSGEAAGP